MELTCCDVVDSVVVINGGHLFLLIPADNVCVFVFAFWFGRSAHARFARALPIHDPPTNERTNIHQLHHRIAETLSVKFSRSVYLFAIRPRAVVGYCKAVCYPLSLLFVVVVVVRNKAFFTNIKRRRGSTRSTRGHLQQRLSNQGRQLIKDLHFPLHQKASVGLLLTLLPAFSQSKLHCLCLH